MIAMGLLYVEDYAKVKIDDDDDDDNDDDAVSWQIILLDLTIERQKDNTGYIVLFYKVFSYVPICQIQLV